MFPYNLNLDIKEKNYNQIKCIRYDNIEVNFYIFDNSQKVNLDEFDIEIKTQFENGNFIIQTDNITKIDNRINCKLNPKFTNNNGEFELQITLLKNNEIKSLFSIDLIVLEGVIKEEKTSPENIITIIKELDDKISEAITTRNSLIESIETGQINDIKAKTEEWTNFKENGGTIGGTSGISIGKDGLIPEETNSKSLGTKDLTFKELWLSDFRKTIPGYTRLANGFILQWGRVDASHVDGNIDFPINFPTAVISISLAVSNKGDVWGGNPYYQSLSNARFRLVYLNKTSNPGDIVWFALGY